MLLRTLQLGLLSLAVIISTNLRLFATEDKSAETLTTQNPANTLWTVVDIGTISPASADVLISTMEQALEKNSDGVLIILDTPGGSLESTRNMVKLIMSSRIPVVVWVGPDGARAGSAGAFISISAHVASMASGTNIGAAHPVQASGQDVGDNEVGRKVENDTKAFIESIAKARGRNQEVAISMVAESRSLTSIEARDQNIIDLISRNPSELLDEIDGREIQLQDGRTTTIRSRYARLEPYEKTLRQELLTILCDPNLFYLMFLAGLIGIGFELTHPGAIVPGVIGAIALILALVSSSVLPISFGALLLTLAGIAFMIGEFFVPSFGILGIGGFIAFFIGSVLMIDPSNQEGLRISLWTIVPSALFFASSIFGIAWLVLRSERGRLQSGKEAMLGERALVLVDFDGRKGRVRIEGEDWAAILEDSSGSSCVVKGDVVVVQRVEGLKLIVTKET